MFTMTASKLVTAYAEGIRDFSGAYLTGAGLVGANLIDADLTNANLTNANLLRANLEGANLRGATLYGANLDGAILPANFHVMQFGPVGSRKSYTVASISPEGKQIQTGCFHGTLEEFISAVQEKAEDDPFRAEYENIVIPGIRWFFQQHQTTGDQA